MLAIRFCNRPVRMFQRVLRAVQPIALLAGGTLAAQRAPAPHTILAENLKAHQLIEGVVNHLGGAAKLNGITSLHYTWAGDAFNGLQGYDPANLTSAVRIGSVEATIDVDYAHHEDRLRTVQVLPGGIHLESVTYFKAGQITTAYPGGGRMTQSPGSETSVTDGLGRFCPAIFARRALQNIRSAIYIGQRVEDGKPVEVVEVSWDEKTRLRAHVNAADMRILSIEGVGIDPLVGDDTVILGFQGERLVNGIVFPQEVNITRRNQPYISTRITEVAVNPSFEASLFVLPNFKPLTTANATNALGGGAYEITGLDSGNFRVIFFDLGDGVAVFDAPESRARSELVAAEIRKTLGDKPIKYLVLSHFHDDHIAGIGYYVDHGVQIVTTRATAPVVKRYATTSSQLRPDLPALGRQPSFLFVDGDRLDLKGTEDKWVSVYKLADCPHVKDMLVAYQPSNQLLMQADLFVELAGYSPTSAAFSRWMASSAAPPVTSIVGTHLGMVSRSAFEEAGRASARI